MGETVCKCQRIRSNLQSLSHLQRSLGLHRLVCHHHVDGDDVLAARVDSCHRVLAGVVAAHRPDHQLGEVLWVVDVHRLRWAERHVLVSGNEVVD